MPRPRFTPSDSTLAKWRDEGLTAQEMVERIKEIDRIDVALGTIYAALSRAGLTTNVRYDEFIPWTPIRTDHANAYPLLMLRLAARRHYGVELTPSQDEKLNRWMARLQAEGVVVHYEHDSYDGWHYVPARPGVDTGLIRELESF